MDLDRTRRSLVRRRRGDAGFTLVELIVVVVIIGVLAAIAVPVYLGQRAKAVDARLKSDVRSLGMAAEAYYGTNGAYLDTRGKGNNGWVAVRASEFAPVLGQLELAREATYNYKGFPDSFCLVGYDSGASVAKNSDLGYYWYSSQDGGLVVTPSASVPPGLHC